MKQVLLTAILAAACTFGYSQKKEKLELPAAVEQSFAKQFPQTKATWEKEKGNYEAGFSQNNTKMSAVFEQNGKLIETETEIKINELPDAVTTWVKEHKKGAAIKEAAKITKASGEIVYEAEVNGKDLLFDANGKFIKEEMD